VRKKSCEKTLVLRYAYKISGDIYRTWSRNSEEWRPINHSCDPNVWLDGLATVARRPISEGEEVYHWIFDLLIDFPIEKLWVHSWLSTMQPTRWWTENASLTATATRKSAGKLSIRSETISCRVSWTPTAVTWPILWRSWLENTKKRRKTSADKILIIFVTT